VDIVAGYKDAKTFHDTGNPPYFNAIVGRVANRIKEGKFSLTDDDDDDENGYSIFVNNEPNSLHGGKIGFSHKVWDAQLINDGSAIEFSLLSPDGDQGFPGSIIITATYSLRPSFSSSGVILQLDMNARLILPEEKEENEKETPINLANHSYFNLGDSKNGILDHRLKLESDSYTPVDETMIPTRQVQSLDSDIVMDFREERTLRDALDEYGVIKMNLTEQESDENLTKRKFSSISIPYGIDHNYIVRNQPGTSLPKVGSVTFGRRNLSVYSDAPGVQIYTANYLGDSENSSSERVCKETYGPWNAICLETQHFPDSICNTDSSNTTTSSSLLSGDKEFWAGKCPLLTRTKPTYKHTVVYRLEMDHPNTESAYNGSDTEGKKFASIEDMWNDQNLSTWYTRASDWYEENCSTTIDGVLGGIGHISDVDLNGSRDFLLKILKLSPLKDSKSKDDGKTLACECGAGIGRVTKGLLLDFADRCDLVESSSRLLSAAPDHVGDNQSHKCRFFCSVLQDWQPEVNKYSIIWIQWTLCYLTDYDIVQFLIRCSKSLVDSGWIILKENTCADEAFVVDVADASITRSLEYWLDLIAKSGLQLKHMTTQDDFPDDIYPVPMLALQR
ncbi:MAG: galactose mutarotase-like enzyme, partial [Bacillariaceae sp.]|jgi:galactose mutarotase-like enzyme